jgi:hypothetical protein
MAVPESPGVISIQLSLRCDEVLRVRSRHDEVLRVRSRRNEVLRVRSRHDEVPRVRSRHNEVPRVRSRHSKMHHKHRVLVDSKQLHPSMHGALQYSNLVIRSIEPCNTAVCAFAAIS